MIDSRSKAGELLPTEPQCEGCGKRPEVYGSSWCSVCHDTLPRYVKDRLITLRNACIYALNCRTRREAKVSLERALQKPLIGRVGAVIPRAPLEFVDDNE